MKWKMFIFFLIAIAAGGGIYFYVLSKKTAIKPPAYSAPIITSTAIIDYIAPATDTVSESKNTSAATTTNATVDYKKVMLSGLYGCLPVRDEYAAEPNNGCKLGLFTNNGEYYALDTSVLEAKGADVFPTGILLNVSGMFTPLAEMDTSTWSKYQIKGVVKVMEASESE